MSALGTVGRFMFALPFLVFGAMHFMRASDMTAYVPIPGGVFWVYLTGVALIAASLAIMTGKMGGLASALLGVMLLIFVAAIHIPGVMNAPDAAAQQMSMSNLLKDMALAGGAWVLAGVFGHTVHDHDVHAHDV